MSNATIRCYSALGLEAMIARGSLDWLLCLCQCDRSRQGKSKSLETLAFLTANPKLDYGEQLIHSFNQSTASSSPLLLSQLFSPIVEFPDRQSTPSNQRPQHGAPVSPTRPPLSAQHENTLMGRLLCHVTWRSSNWNRQGCWVREAKSGAGRRSDASCVVHNFGPPKEVHFTNIYACMTGFFCSFCVSYPTIPI